MTRCSRSALLCPAVYTDCERDARLAGDVGHRRRDIAPRQEELACGLDDTAAGRLAFLGRALASAAGVVGALRVGHHDLLTLEHQSVQNLALR